MQKSLRGEIIQHWKDKNCPSWGYNETIDIAIESDNAFVQKGLSPANQFRKAVKQNNKKYIKHWIQGCRFSWLKAKIKKQTKTIKPESKISKMEKYTKGLTSTQKGAIAENIVVNDVMIETGGRLSPFSPIADDEGIDLLIYDKHTGKSIPIQIKSRTGTIVRNGRETNTVHFEIRNVSIKNKEFAYFLAILLSKDMHSIERAWFIPTKEISSVLRQKGTQAKHIMRANRSLSTNDKYSKFQCENISKVIGKMLKIFESA